ncbi:CopY/TcrY family copper transport repressor [Salinicoccus roseus]|jgi:CopY/TcrY family copper transport repressor|uniref:CopY/TcrY family copper transport repressor n=1 Tax=Salinicoccus roseus TaxID=45670 RepID=UPI001EF72072|nr:CopY/TcrY family copper transport repressor [Salinicoccus roseus]MCG7333524.1 CopY/TcrY family copper transport repressor [Salinicoccus roseus]|tara:strand:- start:457 stop:900 length:444 start_codon:yes stop_codon:yes gene_type:complete
MPQQDLKITDSEWEVMRAVWAQDKMGSREIIDVLQQKKDWGTATIKTFLGRLVKKGMLETEKDGKKFLYSASIKEDEFISFTLDETFDNICDKDAGNTIAGLIEKSILSFDDIEQLERTIEMKKKNAVQEVACSCTPGQCKCQTHHH